MCIRDRDGRHGESPLPTPPPRCPGARQMRLGSLECRLATPHQKGGAEWEPAATGRAKAIRSPRSPGPALARIRDEVQRPGFERLVAKERRRTEQAQEALGSA